MQWSDIPRDPTPRTLRQFAGLCLAFLGCWACWQWLARGRPGIAAALGATAVAVGLLGLARPAALRPVFVGWMVLAFPIGWVVSCALTAALFFLVFTPIGVLFRLLGRDPLGLNLRPGDDRTTYWSPMPAADDPSRYLREY